MIKQHLLDQRAKIEPWFESQLGNIQAPFYASVDIRNAGFKIAPVDTNLFPAGFNNLLPTFTAPCIQAIKSAIKQIQIPIQRILIIPENHSRNQFYLEHLAALQSLFKAAGFDTCLGSMDTELQQEKIVTSASGRTLQIMPLRRTGNTVHTDGFMPELVILNNDLCSGIPAILTGLTQHITPAPELGWSRRLKSDHFANYQQLTETFGAAIGIDPWLVNPIFRNCGAVDFMRHEGIDCLSKNTTALLSEIQKKYDQYQIKQRPFIIIKADAGTYGMGVMTIHSTDEVKALNRKQRTRMAKTKEGQTVSKVILQEGVYTEETRGDPKTVAEPVICTIERHVVGGFYRVHKKRTHNENLNMPGMHFEHMKLQKDNTKNNMLEQASSKEHYSYAVIARLALLAAAREMEQINNKSIDAKLSLNAG